MPFGEVKLIPGVNTERTPTLLEAGVSVSQLIRFKDGLVQKYGGWTRYYSNAVGGVPRDLHAWQDLAGNDRLLVGTTTNLSVITDGSLNIITPQQLETTPIPSFTTVSGTSAVTITDSFISTVTTFDSVMIKTPIAVGGLILSGLYPIVLVTGATTYKITAPSNATASETNAGTVPVFTTSSGSATVNVLLVGHGLAVDSIVVFQVPTTANGVTIVDHYSVATVVDADNFTLTASTQATGTGSFSMNAGFADLLYYISLGPPPLGLGYGLGGYGLGGYGTGDSGGIQTGTPITATDWTSANWGEIILACPAGGGVYQFDPSGGFANAMLVSTAPIFNGGIFISNTLQILFCWGASQVQAIGVEQDPMLISWSDQGDYTSFIPSTTNQAGSFRIPIGSVIRAGLSVANQSLFWTDLDLWAANYAGFPLVFGFNKIGSGAGAISSHSVQQLRNGVYWMGPSNFYSYTGEGVRVMPCPVWDVVFQNLNTDFGANVRAMPNTPFNEAGWFYPSNNSVSGECDSYVKVNISEPNMPWDYGTLARSAWIDQTILGMPIGATPSGIIYLHETTPDADGAPMNASFTSGYFYLAEGEDLAFVDQVIPDMKWGTYGGSQGAQVQLGLNTTDYPTDAPTQQGPYLMTSTTDYIPVRFRNRQMSVSVSSNDVGSFWRLGKIRYRFAPAGRR